MATFGQTSNNGNTQTFSGDRMYASQGTPASNGTITAGKGRVWVSAAASPGAKMLLYSDNAGEPDALLATSDEVIINNTSESEITFPFSGAEQIAVTGSTPYWIAVMFDDPGVPNFTISRANTATQTRFKGLTYPTAPDPFANDGSSSGPLDLYIEYTEGDPPPEEINVNPWRSRIGAWIYPGSPACNADEEYKDERYTHFLNVEYLRVNGSGVLVQLDDPADGCNAYSSGNASSIVRHTTQRFLTLAGDGGAGDTTLLAKTGSTRQADFDTVSNLITTAGFDGVDVDIEGFGAWDTTKRDNFYAWLTALCTDFHSKGLLVNVDCPPLWIKPNDASDWDFNILTSINVRYADIEATGVDFMTIMGYDHQYDVGIDGGTHAVQPYGWIDEIDSYVRSQVTDETKLIFGIPSYGYSAVEASPYAITILTKTQVDALIDLSLGTRDTGSDELFYVTGTTHYVWSDSTTLNAKRAYLEALGYKRLCVWHLGGNDWFTGRPDIGRISAMPGFRIT